MSTSTTGKQWMVGTYVGTTPAHLGGTLVSCDGPEKHVTNTFEPSTGTRHTDLTSTGIYFTIPFKLKVQQVTPFITSKCFVSAEGTLPSFNLYTNDGASNNGWLNSYVDTCTIAIAQTGVITADIVAASLLQEDVTLTIPIPTNLPMTKKAVTTFTIGGVAVTEWIDIKIGVENHVTQVSAGNNDAMAENFPKEATYKIDVKLIKIGESTQYTVDSTTKIKSFVITLTDNADNPTPITFTFSNMHCTSNKISVAELDLTYETIAAVGNSLVIS